MIPDKDLERFGTDGLSSETVLESREQYGKNELTPPKRMPVWKQYLEKYQDPIIRILLVAVVLSALIALLEGGADPNLLDGPVNYHPLDYAAMHGRADVAELLIAFGADMNAKDNLYGGTPLHYAIWYAPRGHLEVAQLLIDRGADVNAKDVNGLTPLDNAKLYAPNAGLLQMLLTQAGAR